MLDVIMKCLLIVLLIMQIFVLIHLAYTNHKRSKEDKIFWDHLHKDMDETTKAYLNRLGEVDIKKEIKDETNE